MYQTIILELLKQSPQSHEALRQRRLLLPTLQHLARELKSRHEEWQRVYSTKSMSPSNPMSRAAALEMAVQDLKDHLELDSNPEELNLDSIMVSLRAASANC